MTKFLSTSLVAAAVLALAWLPYKTTPAGAAAATSPTLLDVHQLKPGDKGYGLTVFSGTQPERFDVEVISVLDNFLPNQDLILVRTNHPRLQVAKVVAGMSGSPIYIGGKMVGAYAYGWQFGEEAVAGVTPISSMLDELKRPIPEQWLRPLPSKQPAKAAPKPRLAAKSMFSGEPLKYSLNEHATQLATSVRPNPNGNAPTPVATPLMVGGLSSSSMGQLQKLLEPMGLEPMQGGGSTQGEPGSDKLRYVDGGAIGVQLIRGDISASGIGTVTRVSGNRLLAFGHPMMNAGVSRLPTAVAKVHWVLASKMRSFKMGSPVRSLGSLINDRQAAIVVDETVEAPTIPLTVEITGVEGAPHPKWNMEVAHDPFMAPMFTAIAMGNAIDATTQERRDVSWHAYTTIDIRGMGSIRMHDFGLSIGGTPDAGTMMMSRAVQAMGAILNNPWETAEIERISMKFDVRFSRDLFSLRGAESLDTEIDPGRPARIRLHLLPFAGPVQTRVVEVPIPRELAGSTVEIRLSPGHQESPPLARPENLRDLLVGLPKLSYAPDVMIAAIRVGGHGVAFEGNVATHLPPSALFALRPQSAAMAPDPVPSEVTTVIPIHQFIVGSTSVHVRVRPDLH